VDLLNRMRWPGWASGPWAQAMTVTGEEQVICVLTWNMSSSRTLKPALYCFAKYQRNHVSRKLLEWYGCRRWMRRRLFFLRKRGDRDFFFKEQMRRRFSFPLESYNFVQLFVVASERALTFSRPWRKSKKV
jgi:hypothetical protein